MGRKPNNPTTTVTENVAVENNESLSSVTTFKDEDTVVIVNKLLANQQNVISDTVYVFDENGKCKVSGKDANIALKINGFTVENAKENKTKTELKEESVFETSE